MSRKQQASGRPSLYNHHKAKPYDRPKSLLRQVASTVRDYLIPSWLLNIASGHAQAEEEDPSRGSGDAASPCTSHSVSSSVSLKRAALNHRNERVLPFSASAVDEEDDDDDVDVVSEGPSPVSSGEPSSRVDHQGQVSEFRIPKVSRNWSVSGGQRSQPGRSRDPPVLINGDDHSEQSDASASTSGCSSLVPSDQEGKAPLPQVGLNMSEAALERLRKQLCANNNKHSPQKDKKDVETEIRDSYVEDGSSSALQRSSFADESRSRSFSKPQPVVQGRRPSFSLTPFGASALGVERSSPFYKGKTTYGGASALRKASIAALHPYQANRPSPNVRVKLRSSSGDDVELGCMSSTAKHILQTLEKMSTPLSDMKKIPQGQTKSVDTTLSFIPASKRWRSSPAKNADRAGPPVCGLQTPGKARIGRNLEPLVSNTTSLDKKSEEVPAAAFPSSSDELAPPLPPKGGGKIRARVNQARHPKADPSEEMAPPDEPDFAAVPLPIKNLPKFSFAPSSSSKACTPQNGKLFTFSVPIQHHDAVPEDRQTTPKQKEGGNYTFCSPICKEESPADAPKKAATADVMFEFKPSFGGTSKQQQQPLFSLSPMLKENPPASPPPSIKPACDLIQGGSVMDILGKTQTAAAASPPSVSSQPAKDEPAATSQSSATGLCSLLKPPSDSWECPSCLVRNKGADAKCVCCETPKPGGSTTKAPATGFGDKFKPPSDSWECPSCLVRNKANDNKCICCEAPKPGGAPTAPALKFGVPSTPTQPFGEKFKPPSGSWECDACMLRNKADASKCVACETPRAASSSTPLTDFKEKSSGSAFKFGVPADTSTASTPSAASTFKFGVPSTAAAATTTTTTTSATSGFKFGVPFGGFKVPAALPPPATTSSSSSSVGGSITFGTTSEAPAFKFPAAATSSESAPAAAKMFGSVASTAAASTATTSSSFGSSSCVFGAPASTSALFSTPVATTSSIATTATPSLSTIFGTPASSATSSVVSTSASTMPFSFAPPSSSGFTFSFGGTQQQPSLSAKADSSPAFSFLKGPDGDAATKKPLLGSSVATFKFGGGKFLFGPPKSEQPMQNQPAGGFQFSFGSSPPAMSKTDGLGVKRKGSGSSSALTQSKNKNVCPGSEAKEPLFGSFDQPPAPSSVPLFGAPAPSGGGIFSFGAPPSQASSTSPSLLFGSTPTAAAPTTAFGMTPAPAFGQTAPDKKPEGFSFNPNPQTAFGSSSLTPGGVFQFGASSQEQPSGGGFSFGSAAPSSAAPGGFSFTAPTFNFPQAPAQNFAFPSSSIPSDNPFNATSLGSSSSSGQRRIRKAVRRIGRKTNE